MDSAFFTDVLGECRAMERLSKATGCTVHWLPEGDDQPRTCMKTKKVYLPRPKAKWGKHERTIWRASAHHEFGHHHPSQPPLVAAMRREGISFSSKMGGAINALDDIWQEMVRTREYRGAGQELDYMQGAMCKRGAEYLAKSAPSDMFIPEICGFMYKARAKWQGHVAKYVDDYLKHVDVAKWDGYVDRVNELIDHPEPAEELIRIVREMLEADGDDPEECKGEPDKPESGEAGDGEDDGESDGDGDAPGKGGKSGDSDSDGEGEAVKVSYKELMGHDHTESGTVPDGAKPLIEYDHSRRNYEPIPLDDFVVGVPKNPLQEGLDGLIHRKLEDNAKVSQRIGRYFQAASQNGKVYQQKRGKLTSKHLTRGMMGDPRVFNKRTERIDTTADVYLLGDASGSMGYGMFSTMACGMISLTKALKVAKVPVKIACFTERRSTCYHYLIHDWNEPANEEVMRDRFARCDLMQNADGDNVMYAYRELIARPSKRKILIVLSDGEPCCHHPGDAYNYLKDVTRAIVQEGRVELYGVGMGTKAVKAFYPEYALLDDESEIEDCIINIVKDKIIRS